jgi:hypothetical protein
MRKCYKPSFVINLGIHYKPTTRGEMKKTRGATNTLGPIMQRTSCIK